MSKLGLLKDSDFKCMHDRKLPVSFDDFEMVEEFIKTIESDVRFLESLRIMDYSLFLIVLEVPRFEESSRTGASEDIKMTCNEIDLNNKDNDPNQSMIS